MLPVFNFYLDLIYVYCCLLYLASVLILNPLLVYLASVLMLNPLLAIFFFHGFSYLEIVLI
jgi:hypothetical protein